MPITDGGKIVAVIAALSGTVILALPIAVVGVTFDDEWVKQAKVNKFNAESTVGEYNLHTRNGTRAVPNLLTTDAQPGVLKRICWALTCKGRGAGSGQVQPVDEPTAGAVELDADSSSTAKPPSVAEGGVGAADGAEAKRLVVEGADAGDAGEGGAVAGAPSAALSPSKSIADMNVGFAAAFVDVQAQVSAKRKVGSSTTRQPLIPAKTWRTHSEKAGAGGGGHSADGETIADRIVRSSVDIAEELSSRGTLFSAGSHQANQIYNVQADLHTLIDTHFNSVSNRSRTILNEQREKLCRSLNTDLKAALRDEQKRRAANAFANMLSPMAESESTFEAELTASKFGSRLKKRAQAANQAGVAASPEGAAPRSQLDASVSFAEGVAASPLAWAPGASEAPGSITPSASNAASAPAPSPPQVDDVLDMTPRAAESPSPREAPREADGDDAPTAEPGA